MTERQKNLILWYQAYLTRDRDMYWKYEGILNGKITDKKSIVFTSQNTPE